MDQAQDTTHAGAADLALLGFIRPLLPAFPLCWAYLVQPAYICICGCQLEVLQSALRYFCDSVCQQNMYSAMAESQLDWAIRSLQNRVRLFYWKLYNEI